MAITWGDLELRLEWLQKKDAYIAVSIILLVLLSGAIVNDFVHFTITEDTENTSQSLSLALLVLHAVSFYLALLGFIYTTQMCGTKRRTEAIALFATVGNFIAFILRATLEVAYNRYRAENY